MSAPRSGCTHICGERYVFAQASEVCGIKECDVRSTATGGMQFNDWMCALSDDCGCIGRGDVDAAHLFNSTCRQVAPTPFSNWKSVIYALRLHKLEWVRIIVYNVMKRWVSLNCMLEVYNRPPLRAKFCKYNQFMNSMCATIDSNQANISFRLSELAKYIMLNVSQPQVICKYDTEYNKTALKFSYLDDNPKIIFITLKILFLAYINDSTNLVEALSVISMLIGK